jgi:hypothetical protein
MPNLTDQITDFVAGTDIEIRRNIDGIPEGQTLTDAWLTAKKSIDDADDAAIIDKHITTTDVPGTGQIVDDGTGDNDGEVRFDLSPAETSPLYERHAFDIWVRTSAGKVYPSNLGVIKGTRPVKQTIA